MVGWIWNRLRTRNKREALRKEQIEHMKLDKKWIENGITFVSDDWLQDIPDIDKEVQWAFCSPVSIDKHSSLPSTNSYLSVTVLDWSNFLLI